MIANVTAEVNRDPARVKPLLLEQITAPVRWEESMARLGASGATSALEFGAGRVLAGLMRRINKGFKVRSVEDAASLRASGQALAGGRPHKAHERGTRGKRGGACQRNQACRSFPGRVLNLPSRRATP